MWLTVVGECSALGLDDDLILVFGDGQGSQCLLYFIVLFLRCSLVAGPVDGEGVGGASHCGLSPGDGKGCGLTFCESLDGSLSLQGFAVIDLLPISSLYGQDCRLDLQCAEVLLQIQSSGNVFALGIADDQLIGLAQDRLIRCIGGLGRGFRLLQGVSLRQSGYLYGCPMFLSIVGEGAGGDGHIDGLSILCNSELSHGFHDPVVGFLRLVIPLDLVSVSAGPHVGLCSGGDQFCFLTFCETGDGSGLGEGFAVVDLLGIRCLNLENGFADPQCTRLEGHAGEEFGNVLLICVIDMIFFDDVFGLSCICQASL